MLIMEKLNIAEILKDCPKGMELDCTMYENVEFDYIEQNPESTIPIHCLMKTNGGYNAIVFTSNGCYNTHPNAKCVIYPKGKTTWKGFQRPFKDGDVIYNQGIKATAIFYKQTNDYTISHCFLNRLKELKINHYHSKSLFDWRLATEEEKERLFKTINDKGYCWNPETKTLEKLIEPKFKVGDKIKLKNTPTNNILTVTKTNDDGSLNVNMYSWVIEYKLQDEYELVLNNQPRFKVGDTIKKKGDTRLISIKDMRDNSYIITIPDYFDNCYITDKLSFSNQGDYELIPNKFDITTLIPFESRVLVRSTNDDIWRPAIYGFAYSDRYYIVGGVYWKQCVPYEGNKHLLGTTNDCDEYFKTWE